MDNTSISYMDQMATRGMLNHGATIIQTEGEVGGTRYVFAGLEALIKNAFVHPPIGGKLVNAFKGPAKIYAGDLIEHDLGFTKGNDGPGATIKVLKTYEVGKATGAATDVDIYIVRNGFVHIPFVGDTLMVAQKDFATKAKGVTVTAVEATTDATAGDVWKVTLSETLGALTAGTVLVEAEKAGANVLPMVTNPNCFAPCDNDFPYYNAGGDKFHQPRTNINFCMLNPDCVMWLDRMGPVPPAVKAMNKSLYPEFWHI